MPRVVGPIRRRQPVQARDVALLRANTDRPIKITIPGPFTMTQQLDDEHYRDEAALALDCAAALNEEKAPPPVGCPDDGTGHANWGFFETEHFVVWSCDTGRCEAGNRSGCRLLVVHATRRCPAATKRVLPSSVVE